MLSNWLNADVLFLEDYNAIMAMTQKVVVAIGSCQL